ncbi:hypothetical protein AKJ09_08163 [Labilithrix luteola]|uniref:Methyl-accepting chemotaxis protein n=1 Tax=Labilithrix luteola TaxID=1391654 RepID=A0A0K1Q7W2_9BACT|nr:hypothetical protein [Labilithrix luteola]AKV01500.1 hypothetical protein AKJ09_08163 [Labilithrix luteola]
MALRLVRALSKATRATRLALPLPLAFAALVASTSLGVAGCKDKAKVSEEEAKVNVKELVTLATEDVAEVERGLPEGAKRMAATLAKEPEGAKNAPAVRSALLKMRQQVPDLGKAKSTFFAFTDDKGIAIRNDLEQDTMAGKDVVGAYPDLKRALAGEAFVATTGQFPGVPNPAGPDKEWVAGVPVKKDDGTLSGLLVTGWTYRRFAYHLQESLKRDLQDRLMREGEKGKLPVLYVFVFDKSAVYGPRGTPAVNEQVLGDLNLVDKTATGPADGTITITDRAFGWAAGRVPKLGPDMGIVVLRSEI